MGEGIVFGLGDGSSRALIAIRTLEIGERLPNPWGIVVDTATLVRGCFMASQRNPRSVPRVDADSSP